MTSYRHTRVFWFTDSHYFGLKNKNRHQNKKHLHRWTRKRPITAANSIWIFHSTLWRHIQIFKYLIYELRWFPKVKKIFTIPQSKIFIYIFELELASLCGANEKTQDFPFDARPPKVLICILNDERVSLILPFLEETINSLLSCL